MTQPQPLMLPPQQLDDQTFVLPALLPLPGLGVLPVNAFVLGGAEPVLIDTGIAALREPFLAALRQVLDPAELRWILLSHADADHTGNLQTVLDAAPRARVATSMLCAGKLQLAGNALPEPRLIAPGETWVLGDRTLRVGRPPYYDAPETLGFHDATRGAWFCVDSFGVLLPATYAGTESIAADELQAGMQGWAEIDAPFLGALDTAILRQTLACHARLQPARILGSHLPARPFCVQTLINALLDVHGAQRGVREAAA